METSSVKNCEYWNKTSQNGPWKLHFGPGKGPGKFFELCDGNCMATMY